MNVIERYSDQLVLDREAMIAAFEEIQALKSAGEYRQAARKGSALLSKMDAFLETYSMIRECVNFDVDYCKAGLLEFECVTDGCTNGVPFEGEECMDCHIAWCEH